MKIAGVIVAGGRGTRLDGRDKLLLRIGERPLIDHVLERVRPQVDTLALNVRRGTEARYAAWTRERLPVSCDPFGGARGPIAGLVAALQWLDRLDREFEWLATFPGDAPFLARNLVGKLLSAIAECRMPVVAVDNQGVQSLCAVWPRESFGWVADGFILGRYRSIRQALDDVGCRRCFFPDGRSFFNINT